MLYRDDPRAVAAWWQTTLGATPVTELTLPGGETAPVLAIGGIELAFFSRAFIAKYSPEVANMEPSVMLYATDFAALHDRLPGAGEIVADAGTRAFNFADPEGHYFAIGEA